MEQDFRQLQAQQSENVIRHTLSREVGVSSPLLQTLFFSTLPALVLSVATCWLVSSTKTDLPWQVYPIFVIVVTTFVHVKAGSSRIKKHDSMVTRLIDMLETAFQVDIDGDGEISEEPAPKADRIDRVARLILERYYLDKEDATREACEAAKVCNQEEWNSANALLKKLGIKGERSFIVKNYGQAFQIYRKRVSVFDDAIHIRHEKNNGSERIKFD